MNLSDVIVYAHGGFRRYDEAPIGLLSNGLNYGVGCFEGIRGYWDAQTRELNLLLVRDHFRRLERSAKMLQIRLGHTADELTELTLDVCARNRFESDVYVRPIAFKNNEDVGVRLHGVKDDVAIVAIPFTNYYDAAEAGLSVCVSSWRRVDDACAPARAKVTGLYVNSALAKTEAVQNGFDEAILLSGDGHVAEGSAENIFIVRDGALVTPDPSQNILEGITRKAVMNLAREHEIAVIERAVDRSELYACDEVFFTGTAAGIVPVINVDRRPVGDGAIGPITARLSGAYERVVRGKDPARAGWLSPVYSGRATARR